MEQTELDRIRQQFAEAVRRLLPGAPIERIEVLQHGDDPEVEPGRLLARVVVAAPDDEEERKRVFDEFHAAHHEAFHELRKELNKLPVPVMLQFIAGGTPAEDSKGPIIQLLHARGGGEGPGARVYPRHGPARRRGPGDAGHADHRGHRDQPGGRRPLGARPYQGAPSVRTAPRQDP